MHTPTPASAHACTAPHQRKYAPRNYGHVVAGSGSDHLLAEPPKAKRTPKASRAPKLLYPDLAEVPSSWNSATLAEFDRTAFLRSLAQHDAFKAICSKHLNDSPLSDAVWACQRLLLNRLRDDFWTWMGAVNGLAGTGTEGGAA